MLPEQAVALRPFESTDAAVVDVREIEFEIGALTIEGSDGKTDYFVPSLILNYGLSRDLELVGEVDLKKDVASKWEIADPGVFLKALLRNGTLQGGSGLSIATEVGVLLPATIKGEGSVGGQAVLIASGKLAPLTYHVNFGGGDDRAGADFWAWGVIGEIPVSNGLTLVGEVAGKDASGSKCDHSALLGVLFEPPRSRIVFDMGVRRGLTRAASDWALTLGLTTRF